jgi:hypothetical protein
MEINRLFYFEMLSEKNIDIYIMCVKKTSEMNRKEVVFCSGKIIVK